MNQKTSQSAWLRTGGTLALGLPAEDLAALSQPRLLASQLPAWRGQLQRIADSPGVRHSVLEWTSDSCEEHSAGSVTDPRGCRTNTPWMAPSGSLDDGARAFVLGCAPATHAQVVAKSSAFARPGWSHPSPLAACGSGPEASGALGPAAGGSGRVKRQSACRGNPGAISWERPRMENHRMTGSKGISLGSGHRCREFGKCEAGGASCRAAPVREGRHES